MPSTYDPTPNGRGSVQMGHVLVIDLKRASDFELRIALSAITTEQAIRLANREGVAVEKAQCPSCKGRRRIAYLDDRGKRAWATCKPCFGAGFLLSPNLAAEPVSSWQGAIHPYRVTR